MSHHTKPNQPHRSSRFGRGRLSPALRMIIAAVVAFIASMAWYVALAEVVWELRDADPATACQTTPPAWLMLAELGRNLVVAIVIQRLCARLHVSRLHHATRLGFQFWIGFPAMILIGSVMWESVPPLLAAIHAGDWLIKLVLITVIVGSDRRRAEIAEALPAATA